MAVAAGRMAMAAAGRMAMAVVGAGPVKRVVLVTREFPLLEGGNSAALLAGLGLPRDVEVREVLGGAPAALEAVADAEDGTLVIGADETPGAGAAAVLCGLEGVSLRLVGRVNRSLPVVTRNARGETREYGDPRLLRESGLGASVAALGLTGPVSAVVGATGRDAALMSDGGPQVPTGGASATLLALAELVEGGAGGRILAVDQATITGADLGSGTVSVGRDEVTPVSVPAGQLTPGPEISISLPAYERAFEAKLRLEAARCEQCGTLSYPARFRCLTCGSEQPPGTVALPRDAVVYTKAVVHVPVPGLTTPYTLVVAELGDTGVRVLVRVTGSASGQIEIGATGNVVFRKVADRTGVPDYGYGFLPTEVAA